MITFDFETKSYANLKKVGTWAYSEHESTDVICAAWGIDHEPVKAWWPGKGTYNDTDQMPTDLYGALINRRDTIEAHHVAFEKSIWINVMQRKYGWPEVDPDQWRDTMAVACYYAMPASLDKLSKALGYGPKPSEGSRLITKYSKLYLKTAKTVIPLHDFYKFVEYCKDDVRREQAVSDELGDLPPEELAVYLLDQKINMRGLYLDQEGIDIATKIVAERSADLTVDFRAITGLNPTQGKKLMVWFPDHGLELDNLQATYLQELLDEGLETGPVRAAIEIRLKINKASTKKLDAMSRQRGKDGRARFQTRYHGAGTGRNTGSGFQPLNLTRGFESMDPVQLVRDIFYGDARWLDIVYGDAMDAISKASRYWIMAEPGNKIIAGDFKSIEAIILACLAGEQWKINAFQEGIEIYGLMADKIYGLAPGTVTKASHPVERQDGKTGELAFGYQGALGAWLKFDSSGRHSDQRIVAICKAWRQEHPATVRLWRELQDAAIEAVRNPDRTTGYRSIEFEIIDEWLTMRLPNGKRIWYREPELRMGMPHYHQPLLKEDCAFHLCDCEMVEKLSYMAQKDGHWHRVSTYGGKLTENLVQATSREILVPATQRAEDAGYHVILTVYDEVVCEVPEDFGSIDEFQALLNVREDWFKDWPIAVDRPWEGQRYRKGD